MEHRYDGERGAKTVPLSRNGAVATASDHDRGQDSLLGRVSVLGAAGAIVIAVLGLLGYVPGLAFLGSIREGYIPMAPSTAVSFIVLGGVLLWITLRSLCSANLVLFVALTSLVSLFGALEVAGYFTAKDLNFEDALVPSVGHLGDIPIARMSPATGAAFFLAGLAALALVLGRSGRTSSAQFRHWAGCLGSLVLGISLLFCLAYLHGSPLLYGQGATVPMALTTALAFLMLGGASVGVAGKEAIPVSLLTGANRPGKPMIVRRRFIALALIMIVACGVGMAIMTIMLYRRDIAEHREQLQATAQSQARLIEAVARHDADAAGVLRDADPGHDPRAATLSQISDAHDRYKGFGETGEFVLARRDGDSIVFVLRHRHDAVEHPTPVAFDSDLAEPMRRALGGLSGTVIGLDYRGETVLAAHEPVAVLNLGIVAKIDLAEIRAPFIRSGLTSAAIALLVVLAGTALFFRIANPIIARLEAYSRDLEKEIEERKLAEEGLRRIEYIVSNSTDLLAMLDENCVYLAANEAYLSAFGKKHDELVGYPAAEIFGQEIFDGTIKPNAERCLAGEHVRYQEWFDFPVAGRQYMDVAYSPYYGLDKKEKGFVVSARDVTQREELIAKLEAQNAELERFTYTVSHDLKSPLITIKGYVGVLRQDLAEGDSKRVEDDLRRVSNAADRMELLLRELLELSRIGRLVNPPEEVSLAELACEATEIVSGQAKQTRVKVDVAPDLPTVFGDRLRLLEVLQNLIDNAVKYMGGQSKPRVEIGSRRDGEETICYVRDNGIGIDPRHHEKVFGLFDQLDPKVDGSGVGLSLVKRIIEVHGGRIWIESKGPGHGSTFCFTVATGSESGDPKH